MAAQKKLKIYLQFKMRFKEVDPMETLLGPTYDYCAELVRERMLVVTKKANPGEEQVTIVEVAGLSPALIVGLARQTPNSRLANVAETLQIANLYREVQGQGKFFAAGEKWGIRSTNETIMLYLDNNIATTGQEGRSSHVCAMDFEAYYHSPIDGGDKCFVAIIGDELPRGMF